jgi:hypothetical protein
MKYDSGRAPKSLSTISDREAIEILKGKTLELTREICDLRQENVRLRLACERQKIKLDEPA